MNPANELQLRITQSAKQEIQRLQESLPLGPDQYLRIGIKGGGCSGISYLLAFDQKTEQDKLITIQDIQIIVNPAHTLYLIGMEIDYENTELNQGFLFINP